VINVKVREKLGWTALLSVLGALVLGVGSLFYSPPSSMRNKEGYKFTLFEHIVTPSGIKAENRAGLEESIAKKMLEQAKAKKDSIAAAERRNDSIKAAMAMKKMKPKHTVAKRPARMPVKQPIKH
jgi:hypothetical protein